MAKSKLESALNQRAEERALAAPDAAYDAMFGIRHLAAVNAVTLLPLSELCAYSRHPFKLYSAERLQELARSIAENGLQQPIIVRAASVGYEILAGHNRVEAFRLNGEAQIPALAVEADDDQAAMIVTETNLRQRDKLLPSEKAFAYKLQLEAVKHQGIAGADDTSTQLAWKSESAQVLGDNLGVSKDEIRRHIRLTQLFPALLELVDANRLAFVAGIELSYLPLPQQEIVYQVCCVEKRARLDIKLAQNIREWVKSGQSLETAEDLYKLLRLYEEQSWRPSKTVTFKRKALEQFLAMVPLGDDVEALFLEFLRERYGK
jgi:ParB family chromosome partitioning protein